MSKNSNELSCLSIPVRRACLVLLACLGISLGQGSLATAQSAHHIAGVRPEGHLSLGGYSGIGAGFRLDIPLVPEGFVDSADDEFALSPGLDLHLVHFNHHDGDDAVLVAPQVAAQWNFYFRRGWSIAPEVGLAVVIGSRHRVYYHRDDDDVHVDPLIAFVARYHFSDRNALVMRIGSPVGFQIGLTF